MDALSLLVLLMVISVCLNNLVHEKKTKQFFGGLASKVLLQGPGTELISASAETVPAS